jgi:MraZ protein
MGERWGLSGPSRHLAAVLERRPQRPRAGNEVNAVKFVGAHERLVDDKGRLALPAAYRPYLGEQCYLSIGEDQCIDVIPYESYEAISDDIDARVKRGELSRSRQRALSWSTALVTLDKQGRINIDEQLRSYAGISTEERVMVAGNHDRLEIWSSERFQREKSAGQLDLAGSE